MSSPMPVAPRLLKSVASFDGCWTWTRYAQRYAQIHWQGRIYGAHVASYIVHKGPVPKGKCVLHTCDNPLCINPEHLWLGTSAENTADKVRKGRQVKGDKTRFCKLTPDDVMAVRAATGSQRAIARQFGVCKATVAAIRYRKSWKHVS